MFLNVIIRMLMVTFEEQFQEVRGSQEDAKVGTPYRTLVAAEWEELSREGKAVLGIAFCCCLLLRFENDHSLKDI